MVAFLRVKRTKHKKVVAPLAKPRRVKVGFPASKTEGAEIEKAVWNEFGTNGGASGGGWGGPIPERPFMRNAMRNNRAKYRDALKSSASKIVLGETTMIATLRKLGALARADILDEHTAMRDPPNSPVTIALKGSAKPLQDQGDMRSSISWAIDND